MSGPRVHQLVHTLTFGDAISGEVFALQRALRESGAQSTIYAINIDPRYKGQAEDYRTLGSDGADEVILHYSLGSVLNDIYRALSGVRRTLIFHNLTPPQWFDSINPRIAAEIRHGQVELPELCALSDRLIADSKFNAGELEALGFRAEVLELPLDPHKWDAAANSGIAQLLRSDPAIHVLHVGRIAPNKCIEDIIKTFYFVWRYSEKPARLWIVGHDIDTELYSFSLKRLVRELDMEGAVNFVGRMADSEVRAMYENATVYLCMSEHEGFCCPVVEAMQFGLPVLAYAGSALPDTVGDGGIVFSEKRHAELAELITRIYSDSSFRASLQAAGRRRIEALSYERFASHVRGLFVESAAVGARSLVAP